MLVAYRGVTGRAPVGEGGASTPTAAWWRGAGRKGARFSRNNEQGARSEERGARSKELGARSKELGARSKEQGARS